MSNFDKEKLTRFQLLIDKERESMSCQEKKIADFLLQNQAKIISYSMSEIAEGANVSQASVVRFCKRLGFSGMKDFKIAFNTGNFLRGEANETINWDDDDESIFVKVFTHSVTSIETTFKATSAETLSEVAKLLASANTVDSLGLGGSAIVASFIKTEFTRLGKRISSSTDPYSIMHLFDAAEPADVMIAVSCSGETEEIVKAAKEAVRNKTAVIAITNEKDSTLSTIATHTIRTFSSPVFCDDVNSFSRFAQMIMITTLYHMTTVEMGRNNSEFKNNYIVKSNYKRLI